MTPPATIAAAASRAHDAPPADAAPAAPRSPAQPPPSATRARARRAPTAVARPPLALRLGTRAMRVGDARVLDRLVRGRAWIALVAVALMGIVFMQVSLLKLNAGISRAVDRSRHASSARTSSLRADISKLDSGERIQAVAAQARAWSCPAAGDVHYLDGRGADGARAAASIKPPEPRGRERRDGRARGGGGDAAGRDRRPTTTTTAAGDGARGDRHDERRRRRRTRRRRRPPPRPRRRPPRRPRPPHPRRRRAQHRASTAPQNTAPTATGPAAVAGGASAPQGGQG